jgi:tRNA nucleotidyltransferase (CCA-adding enzyme)
VDFSTKFKENILKFCIENKLFEFCSILSNTSTPYLVGGALRDIALLEKALDIDIAIKTPINEVFKVLEANGLRCIDTGSAHGTITTLFNSIPIQITQFRSPSARRSTSFSETIEEDLSGRDFTINALAFDMSSHDFIDPLGGLEDLKNSFLRSCGSPFDRFTEDPVRILRMLRFGSAENRTVDESCLKAATELSHLLKDISTERIGAELIKILETQHPDLAFKLAKKLSILGYISSHLEKCVGCEQNRFHINDVFDHTMDVLKRSEKNVILRLAALFHDTGKPSTVSVDASGERHFYEHEVYSTQYLKEEVARLKIPKAIAQPAEILVRHHMRPVSCGPSGVRRLLRDLGGEFQLWKKFKHADKSPLVTEADFESEMQKFSELVDSEMKRIAENNLDKPALDGFDLMKLGIAEGREIGTIISQLKEYILEQPESNTKEQLTELVKSKFIKLGQ